MSEAVLEQEPHTYVAKELAKNVAFVSISIHRWRGQFKIREALVKVGNVNLDKKLVTKPRWDLMPEAWAKKFTTVESAFKAAVGRASVGSPTEEDENVSSVKELSKFPIRGVRIVPRANLTDFFSEIKTIEEQQFKPLVDQFGQQWPTIVAGVEDLCKEYPPEIWKTVSGFLPKSIPDLMSRFWVEKVLIPITLGHEDGMDLLTGNEADQYIQELRAYGEKFTKQVTNVIIDGLESELRDAVDTVVNRVADGGFLKDANLDNVRKAFEKFKAFDFVMTDELKAKIAEANKTLGKFDCKDLNKAFKESGATSVTVKLAEHLKEVRQQCMTDMAAVRLQGRNRRNIKV